MADSNKTEKATPKKRQDERKKGNLFQSKDLTSALGFAVLMLALKLLMGRVVAFLGNRIANGITAVPYTEGLTYAVVQSLLTETFLAILIIILPLALLAALCAVVLTGAQTRFLFTGSKLKPQFSRLSPISGLKKMFSVRSVVELLKSLIKVTIIGSVVYSKIKAAIDEVLMTPAMGLSTSMVWIGTKIIDLAMTVAMYTAFLAAADFLYQWWEYEKEIRMTKQEIKDEYKQTEGDPKVKGRIRDIQRKMASMRMMKKVPQADVVIKNPTHYAVALKYQPGKDKAPVAVAKGKDYTALKIIEIAEKSGVYVTENRPLARGLYEAVELDRPIPEEFYKPVADILAFIYRLRSGKGKGSRRRK